MTQSHSAMIAPFLFLLLSILNTCLSSIHLSPSSHPSMCLRSFKRQTHFSIHLDLPQRLQPITKRPWRYRSSTMVEQQGRATRVSLSTGMLPTIEVSARLNTNTMSLLYPICSCTQLHPTSQVLRHVMQFLRQILFLEWILRLCE